ncbi:MAG TPA: hypothetical protein VKZ41_00170 [Gemmatimonadales bacterium]|nr:hypothetical protein [Gemmatimonadales bacterium]
MLTTRGLILAGIMPILVPVALVAQHEQHVAAPEQGNTTQLMEGLGTHSMKVSTKVPMAQQFFDQGLRLAYAFNHEEAGRSFAAAVKLDSSCAMCNWGVAYVLGPNINLPMAPELEEPAREAAMRALSLSSSATAREKGYIRAMALRYGVPVAGSVPGASREARDSAYATAMREVAAEFPEDADAAALAAEAMMNLRPWSYWKAPNDPEPGTTEFLALLEGAMKLQPNNPGACHFYIHAVEAYHANRAVECAERLAALMPGAGHIVHMPAHIYIRVGRWEDAIAANEHAVHADEQYLSEFGNQGLYPIAYYPHNYHFLAFAATMIGREAQAVEAARLTGSRVAADVAAQVPELQFLTPYAHLVLSTFERWDDVLAEPMPAEGQVIARGLARYARGRALAAKGNRSAAQQELDSLTAALAETSAEPMRSALSIGAHILQADLAKAGGNLALAIDELKQAVAVEDGMTYMEPPYWHQPVRSMLGDALLEAGQQSEAIAAYEEDLRRFPRNVRGERGLERARKSGGG